MARRHQPETVTPFIQTGKQALQTLQGQQGDIPGGVLSEAATRMEDL